MRELIFSARRKDFRVDTFRCGGPGGQNQNKRETGVRITHLDTGISAESREERSQGQNRKIAFKRVVDKLIAHIRQDEQKERYGAGTEVIRSYHEPKDRVTDHQSGATFSYKHTIGKGELDVLIEHRLQVCCGASAAP